MLVVFRDRLIHERYYGEGSRDFLNNTRSATKSVTSLAVGVAMAEHAVSALTAPALAYFAELAPFKNDSALKRSISIADLLTMSSAFDCDDNIDDSPGNEDRMHEQRGWTRWILDLPTKKDYQRDASGRGPFSYCTANAVLLGQIIERASHVPIDEYIEAKLLNPLGISRWRWSRSPSGEVMTGGGLELRSRDLAKIAWMLVDKGRWRDRNVVPAAWVDAAMTGYRKANPTQEYGYLFWQRTYVTSCGPISGLVHGRQRWQCDCHARRDECSHRCDAAELQHARDAPANGRATRGLRAACHSLQSGTLSPRHSTWLVRHARRDARRCALSLRGSHFVAGLSIGPGSRVRVRLQSLGQARMTHKIRMQPVTGLLAVLLLSLIAIQSPAADAPARRTMNFDDFFRVQDLSDPQVSPDGLWVAYVVSTNDRSADEPRSAIWMVSWDGKEHVQLTNAATDIEKPRWSPDGRYLSYIAKAQSGDNDQIMLLDRRGGEPRQLTSAAGDIKSYAWSPDGKRLVIAMQPADDAKTPKPIVVDAWHFKQDEDGYLAAGHARHLYLLDVGSKRLDALTTEAQFNEDLPAWSPDGRQIAFVRTREMPVDADGRADIDLIDANPGAAPKNLARPYAPNNQTLAFSPDGKLLAYLQGLEPKDNAYMQDHLVVMSATGGASRALADKLDRQVMSYAFNADSAAITIAVEDDTSVYPARVDLANGSVTRELSGPFTVSKISSGAGHTALLQSNDSALAEVYALEGGKLRKLTGHNDALLAEITLGAVEDVRFQSSGGAEIHGLIVKPPSFVAGRRYPTLLWIHGGPNGQDEHSLSIDGYEYEPQMFAARGFVVLRVNYRGSSGRGIEFAKRIFADWGHLEVEDLLAGVDRVVAMGIADKDRLAIGGWSYGGLLTDYTIASDRRFKVAVSGAGSGNQLSTYGSDEYVLQYNNELGVPWNNTALWLKVSYPFFHADRIHTPTLFLGGDKDFNVPIVGGEQMYQALRTLGVPAQLVVYPGQRHIFTRPSFLKDLAERTSVWIDRFIPH